MLYPDPEGLDQPIGQVNSERYAGDANAFFVFGDRQSWIKGLSSLDGFPAQLTRSVTTTCAEADRSTMKTNDK